MWSAFQVIQFQNAEIVEQLPVQDLYLIVTQISGSKGRERREKSSARTQNSGDEGLTFLSVFCC